MRASTQQSTLRFRASNAGGIGLILFGLLVPVAMWWFLDPAQRAGSGLVLMGLCAVGLSSVYVTSYEFNKANGQFSMRKMNLLGGKSRAFPLSEIQQISVNRRYFTGDYRTGSNCAFRLTLTRNSGERVVLTGWRLSPAIQQKGSAIADFLGVPYDTVS